jgi:hypothetical protein
MARYTVRSHKNDPNPDALKRAADIRRAIEGIVASACDGTWDGLESAYFPDHNNPPQGLADKLVDYVENLFQRKDFRMCNHQLISVMEPGLYIKGFQCVSINGCGQYWTLEDVSAALNQYRRPTQKRVKSASVIKECRKAKANVR